jgi:hypothetical protein
MAASSDVPQPGSRPPLWDGVVPFVSVVLSVAAAVVLTLTDARDWSAILIVPAAWVVGAWLKTSIRWSLRTRWAFARAPTLRHAAVAAEGEEVVVRGRLRCEERACGAPGEGPCAVYVVSCGGGHARTSLGEGLEIELPGGERVPLEPGAWEMPNPLRGGVGEARLDDGDEVAALGRIDLRVEAGADYRTAARHRVALRPEPGLLVPARGRFAADRLRDRTPRPSVLWWMGMLAIAVVPGQMVRRYRVVHSAESQAAAPRTLPSPVKRAPVKWVDVGDACGPDRLCVSGACDQSHGAGVCLKACRRDSQCYAGEVCSPFAGLCVVPPPRDDQPSRFP